MRILLLYANPNQSVPVSPYGLDTISSRLRDNGGPVEILTVNPFIEDIDAEAHLRKVLVEYEPDLIGISIRNIDNAVVAVTSDTPPDGSPIDVVAYAPAVRRLVEVVREWSDEVVCVVGGSAFTSCPVVFLRYLDLDFGLAGSAETSFVRLVDELSASSPPYRKEVARILPALPGAVYRDGDGFSMTPDRPTLHAEPAAPLDIAPEYLLLYWLRNIPAAVRTKSGCPLRCS